MAAPPPTPTVREPVSATPPSDPSQAGGPSNVGGLAPGGRSPAPGGLSPGARSPGGLFPPSPRSPGGPRSPTASQHNDHENNLKRTESEALKDRLKELAAAASPRPPAPNPFTRKNSISGFDAYFAGPRDIQKHSKWPLVLQMHGSILPKLILPLIGIAGWSTLFTAIHMKVTPIGISSLLLTVLGFVVGLSLSFRSSTAYERYAEGRRYWAQLILTTQNLGRIYWVHAKEREGELGKKDVMAKLTALNLLVAFSVALKHRLRFEPYTCYDDIKNLVGHLDTFAQSATAAEPDQVHHATEPVGLLHSLGEYLGVSFLNSNPRKAMKRAKSPIGNLPLEILSYLGSFTDELVLNGQMTVVMHQTLSYNNIVALNDVLTGTDRVLNTPLPIAYAIAIAQITWVYILLLPFQLLPQLGWITIPGTVAAAYVILGILFIGREIENPFGHDVNDLPLEIYCAQIAQELDIIASRPKRQNSAWIESIDNRLLWPLSNSGYKVWALREEEKIREAVVHKVEQTFVSYKKGEEEVASKHRRRKNAKFEKRHPNDVISKV
ncbi:Bestrophin, RFP-TM, chloride channel-domain-containing protein [Lasiosphaeria miniovina]|uniref:Bestrophin, RFP-TM, chloride channel-domain-containing protein n=1 Tax=Lasiosphaeria miniovina TaxID=1954250 RepID=A0AA40B6U2_9PEZI|nr:Bestrophin, RFP-TM, chloride channel-domain-containing protein [Lasiosphaeria miniovina]KAK0728761.1 Bestrophin, RFP-TM, chloride channel-domain-containing protein [Lasiosphaeria miniovina]